MELTRLFMAGMLLCSQLPAQSKSWDELNGLKPGDRIRVIDTARQENTGTFKQVSPDAISLETRQGSTSIERSRVRKVQIRSHSRRVRNGLIGSAIGLGIGVAADQTIGKYLRNESGDPYRALTYIGPIALIGGIFFAFPAYRTIYQDH